MVKKRMCGKGTISYHGRKMGEENTEKEERKRKRKGGKWGGGEEGERKGKGGGKICIKYISQLIRDGIVIVEASEAPIGYIVLTNQLKLKAHGRDFKG